MQAMINFVEMVLHWLKNPQVLVAEAGLVGLALIIFSETGLLVGFFLPGDSLLISAGLFSAGGHLPIWPMVWILTAAAIIGDATGYFIGKKLGTSLYSREDSIFFKRKHIEHTREFYEKHGGKTIILARFIPIVRTFAPTVAGVAGMKYRSFVIYNVLGAFIWIWSLLFAGYFLGRTFPKINDHIHTVVVVVVILSVLPIVIKWFKSRSGQVPAPVEEQI
jgi:membrane-associated protein